MEGKDLPFPSALISGKQTATAGSTTYRAPVSAQYGVTGYPTTILIDREGKVVGQFDPQDAKQVAEVEKLLGQGPPQ